MHEYTAALRVSGKQLVISEITLSLELEPTYAVNVGDKQQGGPANKAMWSYERFPPQAEAWYSLEDALTALISDLQPRLERIRQLQEKFEVILWCGHFSSSFDGGPKFSPGTLRLLGDFGVALYLDTYFCDERDEIQDLE